jgi:hypothetical protein
MGGSAVLTLALSYYCDCVRCSRVCEKKKEILNGLKASSAASDWIEKMVFSQEEWLFLLTLDLLAYWLISLYTQTYTALLSFSVLLLLVDVSHLLTTPSGITEAGLFGFTSFSFTPYLLIMGFSLGMFGILYHARYRAQHQDERYRPRGAKMALKNESVVDK